MAGFDVQGMTTYTVDNASELRTIAIYGPVSMPLFTVQEGIKYSERLTYFDVAPQMQASTTCATINPSGTSDFDQITLTVDGVKYEDGWCFKDLGNKSLQKYLKPGAKLSETSAPELANAIMKRYSERIAQIHESAIWQASKTQGGSDTNYKQFNGFIQTLETLGTYVNSQTFAGTAYTAATMNANIIAIFQNQWKAVPAAMKRMDNLITVCGDDTFDTLIIALVNANMYHYNGQEQAGRKITLPGTNMVIQAVPGLNSDNNTALPAVFKNRIFTFYKDNMIVGTDNISDSDTFDVWFEKKDRKLYAHTEFKLTTGVFYPQHVVSFKTA